MLQYCIVSEEAQQINQEIKVGKLRDPKLERFSIVWHETGNKSEAYRQGFPNSLKWKDSTVHSKACLTAQREEVLTRLRELQDLAIKDHGVTIGSLLKELDEARAIAITADTPQSSAAITATMSKAKLVGLDIQKIEQKVTFSAVEDEFESC